MDGTMKWKDIRICMEWHGVVRQYVCMDNMDEARIRVTSNEMKPKFFVPLKVTIWMNMDYKINMKRIHGWNDEMEQYECMDR